MALTRDQVDAAARLIGLREVAPRIKSGIKSAAGANGSTQVLASTGESPGTAAAHISRKAPLERLGEVPRALRALALQIEHGGSRPGRAPGTWRTAYAGAGGRAELIGKALRHVLDLAAGELVDEHGRPNAAAALTNLAFLIELEGAAP